MARRELLAEIKETFGSVPGWLDSMPDLQLAHQWGLLKWVLSESALSSREKALVAFGAATAVHCPY